MKIDAQSLTEVTYFDVKPPQYLVDTILGLPVSDKEREQALNFFEQHNRILKSEGNFLDDEILKNIHAKNGSGPIFISRLNHSVLIPASEIN